VGETKRKVEKMWLERDLILLRPRKGLDTESAAKELASCAGVESVHLTSGKYGFLVFAKGNSDGVGRVVNKIGDGDVLSNHYVYKSRKW